MIVSEGKTKIVTTTEVCLIAKDSITAGDGARCEHVNKIGIERMRQTVNVFNLLSEYGIPNSFKESVDEKTIACYQCKMLPIEFVIRRYAWGTFLKRCPNLIGSKPFRFDKLVCEFFHKLLFDRDVIS